MNDNKVINESEKRVMNQKINEAPAHPIFAAILDLYFIEIIFYFLIGLISLITGSISDIIISGIGAILFLGTIIYHILFARNLEILSFGEKLSGRVIINNKLEWQNPYDKNRWLIFLMYIFTFLMVRDSRILSGYMFSLSQLLLYFIEIFIMYYSLVKIGRGKLIGGYILATVYFIKSVFLFINQVDIFSIGTLLAYSLLWITVSVGYKKNEQV